MSIYLGRTPSGKPGRMNHYTVSGSGLLSAITITAPAGVEVSNDGGKTHHSTVGVNLSPGVSDVVPSTVICVRLSGSGTGEIEGKITHYSSGAQQDLAVEGTVVPNPPTIVVVTPAPVVKPPLAKAVPSTLDLGTTTVGTAGSDRTFTVSGSDLAGPLVVTSPTGVEVSSDGGVTYSHSISLAPVSGSVPVTTINVRIVKPTVAGTISGKITNTSAGAPEQDVNVTGTVTAVTPAPKVVPHAAPPPTTHTHNLPHPHNLPHTPPVPPHTPPHTPPHGS
jgi:hypothetical protein